MRQENEILERDKDYHNLNEQVADQNKIIRKLKNRTRQLERELNDIGRENNEKNEELLDTVRQQGKEIDFLNQVVSFLLTDEQLYKIKEKTKWDEDANRWRLAPFQIKQKEISFPKLGNAKQFVQEELDNNEVQFNESRDSKMHTPMKDVHVGKSQKHQSKKDSRNNDYRNQQNSVEKVMGSSKSMNKDYSKYEKADKKMQDAIQLQKARLGISENYTFEGSPDMNRRMNGKAGVTLAPLQQIPNNINNVNSRQSMMSMKDLDNATNNDTHPIMRVQNYKKPQLDKISAPGYVNMSDQQIMSNGGNIQMTFQATINIEN